mmetsp:Transcript_53882/g.163679  ORF Transcript_53882/g.163679 Transcript_53882/m.163679 type:complete len:323 (-) Transcript_53882:58-1026(-)
MSSPQDSSERRAGQGDSADEIRVAENWKLFVAKDYPRLWHSLWCRWKPDGSPVTSFHAERIFKPDGEGGVLQSNIYHYDDERGIVSEGPLCGPWHLTATCGTLDGLVHPARPGMVTWNLPGGDLCWATKQNAVEDGKVFAAACELFVHHDDHLRMSVGIVYGGASGSGPVDENDRFCQTLALVREDARGPWPSQHWSASREACAIEHNGVQAIFEYHGVSPDTTGSGHAVFAGLARSAVEDIAVSQTRWGRCGPGDVILLCSDRNVAIVAPRTYCGAVSCSAAWWPIANVLYIIEMDWDEHGALKALRRMAFPLMQNARRKQ